MIFIKEPSSSKDTEVKDKAPEIKYEEEKSIEKQI